MTRHLETPEQSSGGTCTWALRLISGQYVVDLADKSLTYDVRRAHVWFSEDRVRATIEATPWIAAMSPVVVRARP